MKCIVITSPSFFEGEVSFLHRLFNAGIDLLHLRKPNATADECAAILSKLSLEERRHTVVHQHFEQAVQYELHGIHLNHRCPKPLPNYAGSVSRSCHSLEEVTQHKPFCNYVFLSPIFNSISKQGYMTAFTNDELTRAATEGIIDDKVYALGGVTPSHIPILKAWRFGGAAMLGYINEIATLPTDIGNIKLQEVKHLFATASL